MNSRDVCEHGTWFQPAEIKHSDWYCSECGLRISASEHLIYMELQKLAWKVNIILERSKP